jgi:general secretion pathway protein L
MSRLILRFDDLSFGSFSWLVTETEEDSVAVNWQDGTAGTLAQLAKNHATLTLVIPQQYVFLTSFELPDRASRQILSSIEYQIEDQLAQDVEHQHFAIGDPSTNPLPIAVVEKSIMRDYLALMQKKGLAPAQVIPEMFLCPWFGNPGDVCLLECKDGVILRYGDYQAIKCQRDLIETMLDHLAAEQEVQIVNYYLQDPESYKSIQVSKYPGQNHELSLKQLNPGGSRVINLLQRQFQVTSVWSKLAKVWRWVLGLAVIVIAVTAFNRAIALNDLEGQVSAVKASQYALLKVYLGDDTDPSGDLKKELIELLKLNQSITGEVSFLGLLQEFTRAKTAFSSVTINKIGYQNQRLSIDVTSNQLSEVEALLAVLEKSGQGVILGKLSIKPNLISGQFVLEGGNQ